MATKEQRDAFLEELYRQTQLTTDRPIREIHDAEIQEELSLPEAAYDACWLWWQEKGFVERLSKESLRLTVAGIEDREAAAAAATLRPAPGPSVGKLGGAEKKVLVALLREREANRPDALTIEELMPRTRLSRGATSAAILRLQQMGLVAGVDRIKPSHHHALTNLGVSIAETIRDDHKGLMLLATSVVTAVVTLLAEHIIGLH